MIVYLLENNSYLINISLSHESKCINLSSLHQFITTSQYKLKNNIQLITNN